MWDFGGQKLFMSLHHLFLTTEGVCVVVFNPQELSPDHWPVGTQLVGTPTRHVDKNTKATCIEHLRLWCNAIYLFAPNSPVVVVATCLDLLQKLDNPRARQDEVAAILWEEVLRKTPCSEQVEECRSTPDHYCFFVNNAGVKDDTGAPAEDPSVGRLRDHIEAKLRSLDNLRLRMPLEWLKVMDELAQKDKKGIQRLTFEELKGIARDAGLGKIPNVPLADEVEALLRKFNEWGLVLWYDQALLRDIVVLNPAWLIDAASTIIRDPKLHKLTLKIQKRMGTDLEALYKSAVLLNSLLPHLYPDPEHTDTERKQLLHPGYTDTEHEQLLALLESFLLVAPLELGRSETYKDQKKCWLVPALLQGALPEAELPKLSQAPRHVCFFYFHVDIDEDTVCESDAAAEKLAKGFLPEGLFARLLCKAVKGVSCVDDIGRLLRKSCAVLSLDGHEFMLKEQPEINCIRLSIVPQNPLCSFEQIQLMLSELARMTGLQGDRLRCKALLQASNGQPYYDYDSLSKHTRPSEKMHGQTTVKMLRTKTFRDWFTGDSGCERHDAVDRRKDHDVFISYKHGVADDGTFAQAVCDQQRRAIIMPAGRQPRVFLARNNSLQGQQIAEKLLAALRNSTVVVPLLSEAAFDAVAALNPGDDSHLLLEHWAMLEFYDLRKQLEDADVDVISICPALVPSEFTRSLMERKQSILTRMPDEVHVKTHAELMRWFKHAGLPPPSERKVKDIIEDILKFEINDRTSEPTMTDPSVERDPAARCSRQIKQELDRVEPPTVSMGWPAKRSKAWVYYDGLYYTVNGDNALSHAEVFRHHPLLEEAVGTADHPKAEIFECTQGSGERKKSRRGHPATSGVPTPKSSHFVADGGMPAPPKVRGVQKEDVGNQENRPCTQ